MSAPKKQRKSENRPFAFYDTDLETRVELRRQPEGMTSVAICRRQSGVERARVYLNRVGRAWLRDQLDLADPDHPSDYYLLAEQVGKLGDVLRRLHDRPRESRPVLDWAIEKIQEGAAAERELKALKSARPAPAPPMPSTPPAPPWPLRMFVEEIATRIRSAMEEKNLSLFELAAKLRWAPARLLQWLDGSLAHLPGLEVEEAEGGTLKELVQIGLALDKRWGEFQIGKGPMKEKAHG